MSATVVEQFETAIHAGGTDVMVEIVSDDKGRLSADVTITGEEDENPLEMLGAKDVAAIHALFGRILVELSGRSVATDEADNAETIDEASR